MTDTFKGIITADGKKRQLPYNAVFGTPASDPTLSLEGAFADSKAVGDKFKETKAETDSLKEDIGNLKDVTFDVSVNMLNTEDSDLQLNKRFANLTSSYIMDANNFIISGYIPCTPGNIIRAKLQYQGSNIHTFAFYDASKNISRKSDT